VRYEWVRTNKEDTYGMSQQEDQFIFESRPCRTYLRGVSRRWPFKYVQISEWVIVPIEAVFVNLSSITCV
jgi:hypothetical protein